MPIQSADQGQCCYHCDFWGVTELFWKDPKRFAPQIEHAVVSGSISIQD